MDPIMILGMLAGISLLIWGAMKGFNIIVLAPLAAMVVAVTAKLNLNEAYTVSYMTAMGNYIISYFPMFIFGAIFGEFMLKSGAATSVALKTVSVFGKERVVLVVMIATVLLQYGGMAGGLMFVMYPLIFLLLKEADAPRYLIPTLLMAGGIITQVAPGAPTIQNIIPTSMLGVTPMAAPFMGFTAWALMFVMSWLYVDRGIVKKAKARGEHFVDDRNELGDMKLEENPESFWLSIIPPVVVIIILNVVKLPIHISLIIGSFICAALFYKNVKSNLLEIINTGATKGVWPVVYAAVAIGFGGVIKASPAFIAISDALLNAVKGDAYTFGYIATNIMAGLAGSASGGVAIALEALGPTMLAVPGVNPGALARVVAMSSIGLDSLPHNGIIISLIAYCGLRHKEAYPPMFVQSVMITLIGGLYCVIVANLMY